MSAAPPRFFAHARAFRDWLAVHAATHDALLVGFHTTASGRPCMTWPEAVDEALCVGWIDGVRKNLDPHSYQIRFSPRRPGSRWSAVNIDRVAVLQAAGRMQPAGLAVFARRIEARSRVASYEQPGMPELDAAMDAEFRGHAEAFAFFMAQAPSYRKKALWLVVSAKQAATRQRRLALLIEASTQRRRWE
jgi:uncharacterized protein YdeI (YjbR/CyaY-like superfamily)